MAKHRQGYCVFIYGGSFKSYRFRIYWFKGQFADDFDEFVIKLVVGKWSKKWRMCIFWSNIFKIIANWLGREEFVESVCCACKGRPLRSCLYLEFFELVWGGHRIEVTVPGEPQTRCGRASRASVALRPLASASPRSNTPLRNNSAFIPSRHFKMQESLPTWKSPLVSFRKALPEPHCRITPKRPWVQKFQGRLKFSISRFAP